MLPIIRFKPICLIALLLLAAGALGCGAAATPTPMADLPNQEPAATADLMRVAPTATAAPAGPPPTATADLSRVAPTATAGLPELTAAATATPVADLPEVAATATATPAPKCISRYRTGGCAPEPTETYPALNHPLEELLLAVEEGWSRPSPPWAKDAFLYPVRQWVEVRLSDNLGSVIRWLENNDATIKDVRSDDIILTVVPVSLLGKLSERDGVYVVDEPESFFGIVVAEFPIVLCPPYCGGHINSDIAEIRVGQSRNFFLFSNTDGSLGNLVRVSNIPGDTGEIAIGSCDGPRRYSQFLKNGEYITIAACAPGAAKVELFYQDNASGEDVWRAGRDYVIRVVSPAPRDPGLSPSLNRAVFQVGQSRTFTLNTTIPNPPGVKVSVNDDHILDGNLAIGDCPGALGEGVILGDGDTVTITGCEPGHTHVVLEVDLQGDEYEYWTGYRVVIWAD